MLTPRPRALPTLCRPFADPGARAHRAHLPPQKAGCWSSYQEYSKNSSFCEPKCPEGSVVTYSECGCRSPRPALQRTPAACALLDRRRCRRRRRHTHHNHNHLQSLASKLNGRRAIGHLVPRS